jgi:hypothetical protein
MEATRNMQSSFGRSTYVGAADSGLDGGDADFGGVIRKG